MSMTKITITAQRYDKEFAYDKESVMALVITDKSHLDIIQIAWCGFEKIKFPPDTDWSHSLKIEGGASEGIWLYNDKGYLSRLNYELKPSFRIMNSEEFNRLLGI